VIVPRFLGSDEVIMDAGLEKEHLKLKMQFNALNNRSLGLLLAAELIQEHRALTQRLVQHADHLRAALYAKENPQSDGGTVSDAPQSSARTDSGSPAGAGELGDQKVDSLRVERNSGEVPGD
jgi:hypothetical protein